MADDFTVKGPSRPLETPQHIDSRQGSGGRASGPISEDLWEPWLLAWASGRRAVFHTVTHGGGERKLAAGLSHIRVSGIGRDSPGQGAGLDFPFRVLLSPGLRGWPGLCRRAGGGHGGAHEPPRKVMKRVMCRPNSSGPPTRSRSCRGPGTPEFSPRE